MSLEILTGLLGECPRQHAMIYNSSIDFRVATFSGNKHVLGKAMGVDVM
jgi:hypothetical protein